MKHLSLVLFLSVLVSAAGAQKKKTAAQPPAPAKTAPVPAGVITTTSSSDYTTLMASRLKSEPANPLQLTPDILARVAAVVPAGNLKERLLSYKPILGSPEVSYRQVYWDLMLAMENMPASSRQQFGELAGSLDALFNRSRNVITALKADAPKVRTAMFVGDPSFVTALGEVTKSTSLANNLAAPLGIPAETLTEFKDDRSRKQRFIADYKKFTDLSASMAYAEVDAHMAQALIDAAVTKIPNPISILYRYEFKTGAELFVEEGFLKWRSADRSVTKKICLAELRNDGQLDFDYKSETEYAAGALVVNEDSFVVVAAYNGSRKCDDCLVQPLIKKFMGGIGGKMLFNDPVVVDSKTGMPIVRAVTTAKGKEPKKSADSKAVVDQTKLDLDKNSIFMINGKPKRLDLNDYAIQPSGGDMDLQLLWGADRIRFMKENDVYTGSLLYIRDNKSRKHNQNLMSNKITAVSVDRINGVAYLVGANGAIAKISLQQQDPDALVRSIEQQLNAKPVLPVYEFKAVDKLDLFGNVGEAKFAALGGVPSVSASPDGKTLFYFIHEQMSVINPADLSKTNTYRLTFAPNVTIAGRENDDFTLHLAGFNEFAFPVIKKYSVKRLSDAQTREASSIMITTKSDVTEKPQVKNVRTTTTKEKANNQPSQSIADELSKLKSLYDAGTITREEFDAAKKKLLKN